MQAVVHSLPDTFQVGFLPKDLPSDLNIKKYPCFKEFIEIHE
jgi:hypothetical protein